MTEQGRVAIVTGCATSNGIGAATARLLASNGVIVVATDITPSGFSTAPNAATTDWTGLDSLVSEITTAGGTALALTGDISDEDDVRRMIDNTIENLGRVDILVNNAAAPAGKDRGDIEQVPVDAWEKMFAVNSRGAFLMCRGVVGPMRKQRYGRIVNLSSDAGNVGGRNRTAYSASKAAIIGFTRSLATEVGPWAINVNAVCPGLTLTNRGTQVAYGQANDPGGEIMKSRIPLQRFATPEDIAAVIGFLASEACGYLTGQAIRVNGGCEDSGDEPFRPTNS
jgi:3-oxoacyl-[acyl-carrier protein] reductase